MFRSRKANQSDPEDNRIVDQEMVVIVDRAVNPYLVLFHEPAGFRAEQIRGLRNRLVAMNPDGAPKTLVVTSAVRGEGKSVAAINLAMAFAELERQNVLLVDADMRQPRIESYLNLNQQPGLSDLLHGQLTLERAVRPAGYRGLQLLSAGTRVGNPAEILSQGRIDELFHRLKERFQYVVIDTPPVLPSTDAGMLAARADGTLLVLRLEHSSKSHSKEALRRLQDLGGNVLGSFVTEIRGADPDADKRLGYGPVEE